ncbi:MAG: hypothetical protein ACXVDA_22745 [Ktedonobacterales bacterium]
MAAVTTERLLTLALELAGWESVPADSSVGNPGKAINHIFVGLEVGAAELLIARQLGYHAVVACQPVGASGARWEVYRRHAEFLTQLGMARAQAEEVVAPRVERLRLEAAHEYADHLASIARLLDTPFVTIHSPLQEVGRQRIQGIADDLTGERPDASLADLRDALLNLPEFAVAPQTIIPVLGDWSRPAGRIFVAHGAYAPPDAQVAAGYLAYVDTLLCSDIAPEDAEALRASGVRGNVLVLGSAAMASAGVAPYVAHLRAQGLEVTPTAGILGMH